MATLLESFEVREIAFRWSGTTRVFRNNVLDIDGDEDLEAWILASKKKQHTFSGVWLIFNLSSPYLQRVSPSSAAGNDWIDVKNAILAPAIDVEFFPIYSLDDTVSYVVRPEGSGKRPVLRVKRGMAYPEAQLQFSTEEQLSEYPAWLRNTRTR
ncbi:MAG: hypothetical protein WED82_01895 [Balneolales bacterium]